MARIAFIGLGAMGGLMARRLVAAGHEVAVWNRTPGRAEALARAGARVAETPAEAAAASEFTLTMVRDGAALEAVVGGSDGVLAGLAEGSALVEMSTVGPAAVHALARRLPEGTGLLDAPVLGSTGEAEAGALRIFVGGGEELFRRAVPVLEVLGEPLHVGPLGAGAGAKLVANSTLFGTLGVLGEAVALGDALGLSRDALFAVLAATPVAGQAERRRSALEERSYPPRFALELARKDADLVAAAGEGLDLRLAAAARSWLVDAEASGLGAQDYSAVLALILERAGGRR